jgi:hypothetical protein
MKENLKWKLTLLIIRLHYEIKIIYSKIGQFTPRSELKKMFLDK